MPAVLGLCGGVSIIIGIIVASFGSSGEIGVSSINVWFCFFLGIFGVVLISGATYIESLENKLKKEVADISNSSSEQTQ